MPVASCRLTRRRFLAGAATAVAAPAIVPASVFGAEGRDAPSNRVTLGFIGVGGQGLSHVIGGPWVLKGGMISLPDVQILAAADVNVHAANRAKGHVEKKYADQMASGAYKGCDAYTDYHDLLARKDIDAVLVATPDHWHVKASLDAVKAGKDVYSEKPLSLCIREGRALVDAVRRYGRVFQTGTQQRSAEYNGWFRLACELVRNKRIGTLQSVVVGVDATSINRWFPEEPVPEGFNWDMWLGPVAWRPYNKQIVQGGWFGLRDFSGGGLTNWGAHHFDIAQWALGMDESGPSEIVPPDGKDVRMLTWKYPNGVLVHHDTSFNGVKFNGTDGKIFVCREQLKTEPEEIAKQPIGPNDIQLLKNTGHHRNWLDCIKSRRRPNADVAISHRSVSVCHLGNLALWLGRPLKWDAAAEDFVGDAEASRWLDRPRRDPWSL
jgi:predicted dehydrogenase